MLARVKNLAILLACSSSLVAGNKELWHGYEGEVPVTPVTEKRVRAGDILDFNAISDGRRVYVNWASGNEASCDYYTVEKARDGVHFEPAALIKGSGANANMVDYVDIDYAPYTGISYYRVKQTDYQGNNSYSDVVSVNYQFSKDGSIISCQGFDPVEVNEVDSKQILVVLRDIRGEEFVSKVQLADNSGELCATDTRNKLHKGSYMVIASTYNRLYSRILVVR